MSQAQTFQSKYGPWALVTGAARGLGAEFARQIASRGIDVIIVDMRPEELEQTAQQIRESIGRDIRTIVADLSSPGFIETIREATSDLEIGLLVSNAAFGPVGPFVNGSLEDKLRAVAVNVRAPLTLAHEFATQMASRKRGGIILLSSASALQGAAYVANYAATKAYNLILAEGLWEELRTQHVDVLGLMPGTTRTPGLADSNPRLERTRLVYVMDMEPVITEALDSLGKRPSHITGRVNRLTMFVAGKLMPRRKAIEAQGKVLRDLYEER
jgi:short-subunit dehydrogenase